MRLLLRGGESVYVLLASLARCFVFVCCGVVGVVSKRRKRRRGKKAADRPRRINTRARRAHPALDTLARACSDCCSGGGRRNEMKKTAGPPTTDPTSSLKKKWREFAFRAMARQCCFFRPRSVCLEGVPTAKQAPNSPSRAPATESLRAQVCAMVVAGVFFVCVASLWPPPSIPPSVRRPCCSSPYNVPDDGLSLPAT